MTSPSAGPDIRAALDAVRDGPAALLITGGTGTGKTTIVAAVLSTLGDGGRPVLTRAPRGGDDPAAAVVVDDAHLLPAAELARLAGLADEPGRTLVVAAEPRDHDPGLRTLIDALERHRPRLALGPLDPTAVSAALTGGDGRLPDPGSARRRRVGDGRLAVPHRGRRRATHGRRHQPDRVPCRDRAGPQTRGAAPGGALISTLSDELGAADIAAALDLPGDEAFRLVDQIRGTGLAEPSHPGAFREALHRAVAQTLGAARHRDVESSLLRTQIELSTLSGPLALQLAEHGCGIES